MAGITLIYQKGQIDTSLFKKTEAAIEKLADVSMLLREKEFILLKKGRQNYPVFHIERLDFTLLVDGKIYGSDILKDEVFNSHIEGLLQDVKKEDSLAYFRNLDGEFIIYLFDKKRERMIVVNDFLGRLPVYYLHAEQFIMSRDIGLIRSLASKLIYNEQGIYEFVRLGYPLGNKTLFKNLFRLAPSSIVELNKGMSVHNQSISLEEWQQTAMGVQNQEEALYELFAQAVQNRLDAFTKPMLSLSGGLDSRIIMGEIEKAGQKVAYESFRYKNNIIEADVKVVEKLCKLYKTQFGLTELEEWSPRYFNELIDAKYGMNYLGMAFIIPFLKSMAQRYDVMLTGDGGDKTLAYLYPGNQFNKENTAIQVLNGSEVTSNKICNRVFEFDIAENEEVMRSYLNSYGYENSRFDYKHFLIFERTKNWLFEGEDRNRQYIWSTSPFYHPGFFKMVHSMDEKVKKNFKLYKSFTHLVNPDLNNITNANWGFPIHNNRQLIRLLFKQHVKKLIKSIWPPRKKNDHAPDEIRQVAKENLMRSNLNSLPLNKGMDIRELSQESIFHLLTLLKVDETINNA